MGFVYPNLFFRSAVVEVILCYSILGLYRVRSSPVLSVPKTNYGQFYGVFCREVKGLRGICLSQLLVPISSCWGYFVLGSRTGRLSLLSHSLPQCRPEAATPCNKWHRFQQNSPPHFSWFLAQISNFAQWPGSKTATGERKWASLQLPRLPIPIPLLLWPAVPEEEIIIKVDMGLTDITIYNYVVFRL